MLIITVARWGSEVVDIAILTLLRIAFVLTLNVA